MDLSVKFCGVKFQNPLVLASGILGVTASTWMEVVRNGAGGITTKSIWLEPHKGHPNPVIIATEHFMLNAVGLPDGGVGKAYEEIGKYKKSPSARGAKKAPLIASIVAYSDDHFVKLTREIAKLKPDIIEVNLSCPNVNDEFGQPFACSASASDKVTKLVKKNAGKIPVIVKLSPNVPSIAVIAKACAEAGADGFTCVNTLSGMVIDIDTRMPVLANKVGGVQMSEPGTRERG
ncbi:MAG: dihydroorotate dehydrogenase, partial [Patescibacteria group bacterium]